MLKIQTKQAIADVQAAEAAAAAESAFRAARAAALEDATVTVGANTYNANERSIQRMTAAVVAGADEPDQFPVKWSMADTGPGVMTAITLGDLRQALRAATEQMETLWQR